MEKIPGLENAFKKSKVVFMTTYDGANERTRKMTNYNDSLDGTIWFPTERDTRKIKDIEKTIRFYSPSPLRTVENITR